MRSLTGLDADNYLPQWPAMLAPLPLGPVHGEASDFSAPQPPEASIDGPGQLPQKEEAHNTMARLARPAHSPAVVFLAAWNVAGGMSFR